MKKKDFDGVWTALWTPTDADGELLKDEIKRHVAFLKKAGVDGVVVGGSTGEFVRLKPSVRQQLLPCVKACADGLSIIVNISDSVFSSVKERIAQAHEYDVDAVLVLPPFYFPTSQRDVVAYFQEIYRYTKDLPLLLYNFPECARNSIEIDTVRILAETIVVAGIKQSGSHFDYHRDLAELGREKRFSVLTGSEDRLPEAIQMGVSGIIGGWLNAIPEWIVEVFHRVKEGEDVAELQAKIHSVMEATSPLLFPLNIAAGMEARGLTVGETKIPYSAESLRLYRQAIEDLIVCGF